MTSAGLVIKLRSRAFRLLMRAFSPAHLRAVHERPWMKPMEWGLGRGQLHILGGLGVRIRLCGAHFPYWGTQAYGMLTGEHEVCVQQALQRYLGPRSVFIDVGSNIGVLALAAARLVGPTGRVIAVDPLRECVEATAANARLNRYEHVEAVQAAAAAASGEAEVIVAADALWTRPASVGPHPLERRREVVRAISLDDLMAELRIDRVDLIKIDVEGAELDVVAGMRGLLARDRPVVVCEMHGKNSDFCAAMQDAGYRVTNLDGPQPVEDAGGNIHALAEPVAES